MSLAEVGIIYGTLPFVWMVLMPGSGAGVVPGRLSLVPLLDLSTMGLLGIIGNLLVFTALGVLRPDTVRGAGVSAAHRDARGRLLGPDRKPRNTSCSWTRCPP